MTLNTASPHLCLYKETYANNNCQLWTLEKVAISTALPYSAPSNQISTKSDSPWSSYWWFDKFSSSVCQGTILCCLIVRLKWAKLDQIWEVYRPIINAPNTCLRFHTCCLILKLERIKGDGLRQGCCLGLERLGLEVVSGRFLERLVSSRSWRLNVSVSSVWKNRTSRSRLGLEDITSRSRSRDFILWTCMQCEYIA